MHHAIQRLNVTHERVQSSSSRDHRERRTLGASRGFVLRARHDLFTQSR
jgi:hypothetical protein